MKKIYLLKTLILGGFLLFFAQGNAQVSLFAVDDGTAFSEMPDSTANSKNADNIFVYKTDTTEAIAFVKFNIADFAGKRVSEAVFSTRSDMNDGKTMTVKLTKAGSVDFTRDSLTWNNKPSSNGELATAVYDEDSGRKEFTPAGTSLIDYINEALAQRKEYVAFGIKYKEGDGGDFKWAGGAGNGSWGPMLELSFENGYNYWAADDGTAFKENPDTTANWKNAANIFVYKTDETEAIAFIKFVLPGFAYKSVETAEFSTRSDMNDGTTMTVSLKGANSSDFTREELTWNNKPGTGNELATVIMDENSDRKTYSPVGNKLVEFINNELAKGKEEIGFALQYKNGDGGDFKWAGGAGNGAWGPMLMVTEGLEANAYAVADGFATQDEPDSTANAYHTSNIYVSKASDDTEQIAYVKFDISQFTGRMAESVKFSTRSDMADGATMTVGLHKANSVDFERSTLTWNNRPGVGNEVATVVMDDESNRKYYVSTGSALLDYVNTQLMAGAEHIAFALKYKSGDGGDFKWAGGKGDGDYGPLLELEFGYGFNSYAIDDGTGFKENPDTTANWKNADNIFIYKTDTTEAVSYVKFNVSALAGKTITSAVFSTRSDMEDGTTMTVALTGAKSTDFTRDELTWNNKPGTGEELATVVMDEESARKEYTPNGTILIDYINSKIAAMDDEIAFALKYKEGDGGSFKWAGGAGNGTWGPQLEIEIEPPYTIDSITVIEDAYVLEAYPDSTGEGVADMQIGKDDANSADKETYLKFPLENQSSPVGKVTLVLKGDIKDTNPDNLEKFTIEVLGVSNEWSEDTIDWENKPVAESEVLVTYDITGSAQHNVTADALTHYINEAVANGATAVSFIVQGKDDTGLNRAWISSKEWVPAMMILDYTVAPPAQESTVIEDAYVSQVDGEQDSNYGGEADQHLIKDDENNSSKWVYFKYDISNAYDDPVSAVLKLYGSIHNSATEITSFDYQIFAAENNNWTEDTITWNNKPVVSSEILLEGSLKTSGAWYELSSPKFSEYVINAIADGDDYITLVAKGKTATPGNRAWISGKEWRASSLLINYEPQVEAPVFNPAPGEFISMVEVEMRINTPNAVIYYTTDGSEPSDASMMYTEPVQLNESTTLKAIGYADELKPSLITTGEFIVHPVGVPEFFPSPLVTYTDDNPPVVKIMVEPDDAIIYYSDDGSDPATPYPDEGIPITATTTLKAQAYSADGMNSSEIVEVTYVIEETVEGIGVGPGGVGYPDNSITGQPENTLWLKADELTGLEDGDLVTTWTDMSGNENDATDIFAGIRPRNESDEPIYHKTIADAPQFVANGTNGLPSVNFGPIEGREDGLGALSIPDVMNGEEDFDGMGGLSLWVVLKRNQLNNWQAIVEKRDFTGSDNAHKNAWILEFNGSGGESGDENKPMLTLNKEHFFTGSEKITNTEETYIIGADHRAFDRSTIWLNGRLDGFRAYDKPINDVEAPLVIGNAAKANISEIIFFKNELNAPQKVIVQNYLAAKYGLDLYENHIYTNDVYTHGVIGVGKAMYGDKPEMHVASSGGGLQLEAAGSTLDDGEYILAGHNGAANSDDNDDRTWARRWYVETSEGTAANVTMGFDFAAAGLATPASADGYALWYSADGETYTALGATAMLSGDIMSFELTDIAEGYYVLSGGEFTGIHTFTDMSDLVRLYPNPTENDVNLSVNNAVSGNINIRILNMTGSVVKQIASNKLAGPHTENISVGELSPGIYFVEVIQNNKRALKRMVKK